MYIYFIINFNISNLVVYMLFGRVSHCTESIWLAVTNERIANFMEVQVQGSNCIFPLSLLILYVLLEHLFESTLSQIFVTAMGTSSK